MADVVACHRLSRRWPCGNSTGIILGFHSYREILVEYWHLKSIWSMLGTSRMFPRTGRLISVIAQWFCQQISQLRSCSAAKLSKPDPWLSPSSGALLPAKGCILVRLSLSASATNTCRRPFMQMNLQFAISCCCLKDITWSDCTQIIGCHPFQVKKRCRGVRPHCYTTQCVKDSDSRCKNKGHKQRLLPL